MIFRGKFKTVGTLAASVLTVVAISACGDSGGGGTTSMSNGDLLKAAAKNMRALKSYTVNADIESAGQAVKMDGNIDTGKNNIKLDVSQGEMKASVIGLGDAFYVSQDGTTWIEAPAGSGTQMTEGLNQFTGIWSKMTDEEIDKGKDKLKDGSPATEKIGTDDTKHMTASSSDFGSLGSAGGSSGNIELWITTNGTNYVRQMKIDSADTKGTIQWSDFGKDFDIKAPNTGQ